MKAKMRFYLSLLMAGMLSSYVSAQITLSPAVDIYSTYLWRGSKIDGPSAQPSVVLKAGNLTVGSWGSFGLASGYTEVDLYASYAFAFGLSVGVTDYYYPYAGADGKYQAFKFSKDTGASAIEANVGYTINKLSFSANYIVNESVHALSMGGDKYFEASYAFEKFSVIVGAGDGWHTKDTKFMLCNVAVKSTKEIKITDSFSIPVTGMLVVNPDKELICLAVGLSF